MTELGAAGLEDIWRQHSRKVLATLIRLLRDFDLAEEALHDAFLAAAQQWPNDGIPANPLAWLVSAGRFRALDKLRRRSRFTQIQNEMLLHQSEVADPEEDELILKDDQLRLIFVCCHPALPPGSPGYAHPARGLRADNRRSSHRIPYPHARHGPAHRARQGAHQGNWPPL